MSTAPSQAPTAGMAGQPGQRLPIYRPEQIRGMPYLNDEEKTKYEHGLRQLWASHERAAKDSVEARNAKAQIIEFGKSLMQKLHQRKLQQQSGQAQAQGQAQQAQAAQATQAARIAANGGQAQLANAQRQATAAAVAANAGGQPALAPAAPGATGPPPGSREVKVPEHIARHVAQMTFHPPPSLNKESAIKWSNEMRQRYARALVSMDAVRTMMTQLESVYKERQEKGNPFTPEEMKTFQLRKEQGQKQHSEAQRFVDNFRKQQESISKANSSAGAASIATAAGAPQKPQNAAPGPGQATAASVTAPAQNSQGVTAVVNAAVEAAKNQQATGPRPPAQVTQKVGAPPTQASQINKPQPPAIKTEQPHPPPVNTAIASAASMSQSAGTPTQNSARVQTPQTATPQTATAGGAARALSMSAALSLANQRNSQPGTGAPAAPNHLTGVTQSGGGAGSQVLGATQSGNHNYMPQGPFRTGMPIPKQLPEKITQVPQPVEVRGGAGQGRPTYTSGMATSGGVLGQPAVAKIPQYTHEAEGEHVLSKKKLDELVRQVCGGVAEGQEGNLLTPEVEENILGLADSFVDNVLNTACRMAKERGSKVLEIRDIQLVLERVYNIRVPGYSSDELRTVRKVQPSAAWIAKMSAVQAAKVMPGKGE